MNIESRLTSRIGITGKKLHTGRSRNDQVATDIRLYVRDEIDAILAFIAKITKRHFGSGGEKYQYHYAGLYPSANCPAGNFWSPLDGVV